MIASAGPYASRGLAVRALYLGAALSSALRQQLRRLSSRRTVVLCYHGVTDSARFATQMRVVRAVRAYEQHAVNVTFDDAFANLLPNAIPVLLELGLTAKVFAVVGNCGAAPRWDMPRGHPDRNEVTMTAAELCSAQATGCVRVGSHTLTHPDLTRLDHDAVRRELLESKQRLEDAVQQPVEELALPYGAYNRSVLDLAQLTGYRRVYTLDPLAYPGTELPSLVGRFSMSPDAWQIECMLTCTGAYSWLGPWRRCLRRARPWLSSTLVGRNHERI